MLQEYTTFVVLYRIIADRFAKPFQDNHIDIISFTWITVHMHAQVQYTCMTKKLLSS